MCNYFTTFAHNLSDFHIILLSFHQFIRLFEMTPISKNQVKYVRSLQQKKVRDSEGVFVAEGHKCIHELLPYFRCIMFITSSEDDALDNPTPQYSVLHASHTEIEQMSSLRTPQGEIAVFQRRKQSPLPSGKGLILALDGIQDPGNLGTIIRTADWFGIRHIVCSHDTGDCWNPKVVQATMGALARVQLHYTDLYEWIGETRGCSAAVTQCHMPVYGTLLDGVNMYAEKAIPQKQNGIIIMGNEGNGISPQVRSLITHPLYIPPFAEKTDAENGTDLGNSEKVESLNVAIATAIILAEFRR